MEGEVSEEQKRVFVVAGSHQHFATWARMNHLPRSGMVEYLGSPFCLYGRRNIAVYRYPTWLDHREVGEIGRLLAITGVTWLESAREVRDYLGLETPPDWKEWAPWKERPDA
jgi:hypothetical protein